MSYVENSKPIPKWMQLRYSQLWQKTKGKPFSVEKGMEILNERKEIVIVILSRLRQTGWLTVELDQENIRKRLYSLKNPEKIFLTIGTD